MTEIWKIVLSSALVSAAVSTIVSAAVTLLTARWTHSRERDAKDVEVALKMAELEHDQLVRVNEWSWKRGVQRSISFTDPFVNLIKYRRAIAEFRSTGSWKDGEAKPPLKSD